LYFDGSDVGLNPGNPEDIDGVSVTENGDIYLTTRGDFDVGLTGADEDVFICVTPTLVEGTTADSATTACTGGFSLYFDGGTSFGINGANGRDVDGIAISGGGN
jgi:hypothetical protein